MDQGYKHFSHLHNLIMHQMPEGIEVSCSGCHSSATETVHVCWQCNFFLHDQCYRASRSLKHPSHPPHPLTLVPYPTYHSNSFYCNSCQAIGTGFSYSCADCEFDLHVQCAYSISLATSFSNAHQFHELVPAGWNGVPDSNINHQVPIVSVPESLPIPFDGGLNNYMPPNSVSGAQYHSTINDIAPISIPPHNQNSFTTALDPSMAYNLASGPSNPSDSVISSYDPSMPQSRPSVFVPTSSQNQISVPTNALDSFTSSHDPSMPLGSVSVPTGSQNRISVPPKPLDSYTSSHDPSIPQGGPSVPVPTTTHNQISIPNNPTDTVTIAHDLSMPQGGTSYNSISVTSNPPSVTTTNDASVPQNGSTNKHIMHFSHPHKLSRVNLEEDEENEVLCSGCEDTLVGNGYSCVEPDCDFHLHESCFHLNKEIHHKSHPEHPLTLLPLAPYDNESGEFTCAACFSDGTGFTYHCSICEFDLHIQCVSLPETVQRDDHKHMLKLFYSCPVEDEDYTFSCDVCHGEVPKDRWVYYCEECDYGTHLGCVDCEECEKDSILDTQTQLQMLQMQIQMSRQQAQFIASMGASMANLAG